jgi:hypothetical protein
MEIWNQYFIIVLLSAIGFGLQAIRRELQAIREEIAKRPPGSGHAPDK